MLVPAPAASVASAASLAMVLDADDDGLITEELEAALIAAHSGADVSDLGDEFFQEDDEDDMDAPPAKRQKLAYDGQPLPREAAMGQRPAERK